MDVFEGEKVPSLAMDRTKIAFGRDQILQNETGGLSCHKDMTKYARDMAKYDDLGGAVIWTSLKMG